MAKIAVSGGEAVSSAEIAEIPLLKDAAQFVARHPGCIRRRVLKAGEAICRQGDAGRTAYFLKRGSATVHLEGGSRPAAKRATMWQRVARMVGCGATHPADRPRHDRPISVDGARMVSYGKRLAVLKEGDLFGEIACLTRQPRSATVVADETCEVLEIVRTVLERLRDRSEGFKRVLVEADRRKLSSLLGASPVFRDLKPEVLEFLTQKARPMAFAPGTVIFSQGEEADALYVIRIGQVRVWKRVDGAGEITVSYLTEGDVFGEMGILESARRTASCSAYGQNNASRRWYAHPAPKSIRPTTVEVFRIDAQDCVMAFESDPKLRRRLERLSSGRKGAGKSRSERSVALPVFSPRVEQLGLTQGQRLLTIDLERCTRCDQCVQACVASHDDGLPRLIREGPRIDQFLVPSRCRSCMDPVCMIGCPVGSIARRNDLSMFIEDWCIGCGICAENCPYGSIQMHPREKGVATTVTLGAPSTDIQPQRIAAVCDQCHTLPTGPACQYACPHDAIVITDWSKAIESQVPMALDTFSVMAPTTASGGEIGPQAGPSRAVEMTAVSLRPPSPGGSPGRLSSQ